MFEYYDNMTIDELNDAKTDVFNAIQNEKLWQGACLNDLEITMHQYNIESLRYELHYILDLIDERTSEDMTR